MALLVKFTVATPKFALFDTLRAVPDATLEPRCVIDTAQENLTVVNLTRTNISIIVRGRKDHAMDETLPTRRTQSRRCFSGTASHPSPRERYLLGSRTTSLIHSCRVVLCKIRDANRCLEGEVTSIDGTNDQQAPAHV